MEIYRLQLLLGVSPLCAVMVADHFASGWSWLGGNNNFPDRTLRIRFSYGVAAKLKKLQR